MELEQKLLRLLGSTELGPHNRLFEEWHPCSLRQGAL